MKFQLYPITHQFRMGFDFVFSRNSGFQFTTDRDAVFDGKKISLRNSLRFSYFYRSLDGHLSDLPSIHLIKSMPLKENRR